MNFVSNNNSEDKRNEQETRALQESGAALSRSQFDSVPNSEEFRARLKNQLLEKRQLKRTSMWEKIKDGLSHIVPTQKTFVMGMVVVLLVALVSTMLINRPGGPGGQSPLAQLLIDKAYARDNFEIIPTSGDGLAVDNTTEFIIKSKTPIDNDILIQNIHLEPDVEFILTPVSQHEFRVTPKQPLGERQVYTIKIDAAYKDDNNVTVERDFSFAFQVKNKFKILSTVPGNGTQAVPTNTGIEFTFSSENFSDYEKNFSITPKAEGKFEVRGRTLTFVPKQLQPSTLYTVTLKKDIKVQGAEPMTEDFVLRFETQSDSKDPYSSSYWYLYGNKAEMSTAGPSILRVGVSVDQEFEVKAYAFKSFDAYKRNYLRSREIPSWAVETNRNFTIPAGDISLAREFSVKSQAYKNEYERYIVFPENLPKGVYWVELSANGQKNSLFLEVTDLASYLTATTDKALFWSNSIATKAPLSGTKLSLASGEYIGETNKDGVLMFDSKLLGITTSTNGPAWQEKVVEIAHGNEKTLLAFTMNSYVFDSASSATNDYVVNLSADRPLYTPSDTIKFWGYIANRDGSRVTDTLTVGIPNNYNYFYGRHIGDMGFLYSVNVTPDDKGFFRGEIKLNNMTQGGYNLILRKGDDQLQSHYVEVSAYVKPNYTLSVTADKKAVFAGEQVSIKANVNFFEGTPVPNYALKYENPGGEASGSVTTDKNGEANFKVASKIRHYCDLMADIYCSEYQYGSIYQSISVSSEQAEESPLYSVVSYLTYESKVDGNLEFKTLNKTQAVVSSTWKNVNLSVLNNDDPTDDEKVLSTVAAGKKVEGVIVETHWEKKEIGQYYDFFTKTTEKTYTYETITTTTGRFTGETDARGHFEYKINMVPERHYEVRMKVYDGAGNSLVKTASAYSDSYYDSNNNNYTWYSLREKAEKTDPDKLSYGYKIGDKVELEMYRNNSVLSNPGGHILFTELQDGLKKYTVQKSPQYSFTFGETYVPNVYVGAVYFDGAKYVQTEEMNYRQNIRLDTRERELKVDVTADKTSYKPGENVKLQIKTTNKNGKGHSARVNVSVIDEAFLALTASNAGGGTRTFAVSNPLPNLYRSLSDGTIFTVYSHKNHIGMYGGAEGGGCFLSGTKITLKDGIQKNIEDIQVGDMVQTLKSETDNTPVYGRVTKTQSHIVSEYLIVNGKIRVTPEHRILVNGEWKTAGDMVVGDRLRGMNGEPVEVVSIEHHRDLIKVYNFEVENYHTYIAEGIYVHNDKGGGPARSLFPDNAFYGWVDTDNSGNGTIEFKLPDSVTSWRVTGEAISPDRYAGIGDTNVDVTLPVFGIFSVPKDLLIGDKPTLSALAYGNNLKAGDTVDFTLSGNLFTSPVKKQSKAFERNLFPVNRAVEGRGKVRLDLRTGRGNDAIEHSYTAVASRIEQQAQLTLPVQNGPVDLGSAKNANSSIELHFADAGRGSLYNRIYPLTWNGGSRLDQKVGSVVAKDWFKDFFAEDELSAPADLSPYLGNQGFKLLPYSSEDLILSAKASAVLKDSDAFDAGRMRSYFVGHLYNTEANEEELAVALWGAAALGEPVIPSIHSLADKAQNVRTKIFLALAATELGDNEYARTLYEEVLKNKKETDTMVHIDLTKDKNMTMENTALMAIVSARLQDPLSAKLDTYVRTEPQKDVYALEELLFIKEKLAQLPAASAKATLTVAGESEKIDLSRGQTARFEVAPHNFGNISLSDVEGSITLLVNYDTPVTGAQSTNKVSVTRKYFVNGKETNTFKEGQQVEVRLYPNIAKDAPAGNYLIVDSLPSGLKLTSPVDSFGPYIYGWCIGGYPFEVNGQSVKFMFDRDMQRATQDYYGYKCDRKDYLSYYTRVSTIGEFKKEAALIQSVESKDVKNFSTDVGIVSITE